MCGYDSVGLESRFIRGPHSVGLEIQDFGSLAVCTRTSVLGRGMSRFGCSFQQ